MKAGYWQGGVSGLLLTFPLLAWGQTGNEITLLFDNVPVEQVLHVLADFKQLNLIIKDDVKGTVSVRLTQLPWPRAVEAIARLQELSIERQGNMLFVQTLKSANQAKEMRYQQQRRNALEKNVSAYFQLNYIDVSAILEPLLAQQATLFSAQGSFHIDHARNGLQVQDLPHYITRLKAWIAQQDRLPQQVQLAAHIVNINQESLKELGVRWGMNLTKKEDATRYGLNGMSVGQETRHRYGYAEFNIVRIGARMLEMELSALEQQNKAEIIASPYLMASDKQTASIKQGNEIPYEVATGDSGSTTMEFKEAVLGMEVTPTVMHNNKIMLSLLITQNTPGKTVIQGKKEAISIDKQEIRTNVTVDNGETVILGGVFQQQSSKGATQVPGLGNIPLLGALFRDEKDNKQRRELAIFITPIQVKHKSK